MIDWEEHKRIADECIDFITEKLNALDPAHNYDNPNDTYSSEARKLYVFYSEHCKSKEDVEKGLSFIISESYSGMTKPNYGWTEEDNKEYDFSKSITCNYPKHGYEEYPPSCFSSISGEIFEFLKSKDRVYKRKDMDYSDVTIRGLNLWDENKLNDGGMEISWGGKIGYGLLTVVKQHDGKITVATETMGKDFAKFLLNQLVDNSEIKE